MCRRFPLLRVVGLDVLRPALGIARKEVAAAGVADRIELREQSVSELDDRAAFDLAWLPQSFIAPAVFARALPRILHALRPGGWLVLALAPTGRDGVAGAFDDLLAEVWGGGPMSAEDALHLLGDAGFVQPIRAGTPLPADVVLARRAARSAAARRH